ncbi:unnamed protein product [Pneumocystis jirovecii]|uniref:NADH-ubiquinone oxidoreductase 12 kDa subunit, mitochondrial n=2 Tax=Pneumocystis jirovecii TaxID=42068 RepID=L0PDS1_PNEJI|nr:uncharacterized protein T551_01823 [Pneumocystis jirovecii RU7]KTW30540.1 hypothetical protein T551_01823 [Pneumocystis jirovecii RU7]CCJ30493.1 unnamed protein product [Pneumocystis jirovecii]
MGNSDQNQKKHERVLFDEIDYENKEALNAAKNYAIRETWIRAMEMRLVREELDKCYKIEGVNHYENCRELSDRYWKMLRQDYKVKGYLADERMIKDL